LTISSQSVRIQLFEAHPPRPIIARTGGTGQMMRKPVPPKNKGGDVMSATNAIEQTANDFATPAHQPTTARAELAERDNAPRTISPKKLAANRANAARSTGPRTPAGKCRSALNALTHGLRARLTAQTLVAQDEREDFDLLAQALHEELNPRTPLQHLLAERIALLAWKLRRAAAAEASLIDNLAAPRRHGAQERNQDALRRHDRAVKRAAAACDPHHPAPQPPNLEPLPTAAQTLADLASRPTTKNHNPWLTLHRYEQAAQREFHKALKQYQSLQQQHEEDEEQEEIETGQLEGPNEPTAPSSCFMSSCFTRPDPAPPRSPPPPSSTPPDTTPRDSPVTPPSVLSTV
jgi:hypothetical protein